VIALARDGQAGRVPRHPEAKAGQPQKALPALLPRRAFFSSIGLEQIGHAGGDVSGALLEICACGSVLTAPDTALASTPPFRSRLITTETIAAAAKRSGTTYWPTIARPWSIDAVTDPVS
jgi:hypothetical protein